MWKMQLEKRYKASLMDSAKCWLNIIHCIMNGHTFCRKSEINYSGVCFIFLPFTERNLRLNLMLIRLFKTII